MASTSAQAVVPNVHDGIKIGTFIACMIGTVLLIVTTAATLSGRIAKNEEKTEQVEKRVDNIDVKLDKILDKVSGIDVKLERKQDKK